MCLAVPHTVERIDADGAGYAVAHGVGVEIRLDLIEEPRLGDVVLVHAGFAIQKLEARESEELSALWDEINKAEAEGIRRPS